ncbi:MAG: aminopeptidase P family protein [Gammaproteobacteria bacterium]|nr:aminopeptidase P family protein [Gammaproteobacteria bacterium]
MAAQDVKTWCENWRVEYRGYALFQSHIPSTYLFVPVDGPVVLHGFFGPPPLMVDDVRPAQAIAYFNGGGDLVERARCLATDVKKFLAEIGTDNRRIAVEYVNPSVTQAFENQGLEVIDAVGLIEDARVIKSSDEIECMKWAIAVADLGITKIREMMRPGISEVQLWALLNYTNLANNGDWHDGRMLVSGDRINPWYQEASERKLEAGDLLGFDTDMVGPFGYFADISRTFFCGPGRPSKRQKSLYRLALDEIEHNLTLLRPGVTLQQISERTFVPPEEFHPNRYTCILHGVGMCDEFPKVYYPQDIEQRGYEGTIEKNMVLCVESYIGAVGERDGVKLEQQVLITDDGYELLSTYPFENSLLE